jgi:hypothetical protein
MYTIVIIENFSSTLDGMVWLSIELQLALVLGVGETCFLYAFRQLCDSHHIGTGRHRLLEVIIVTPIRSTVLDQNLLSFLDAFG